MKLVIIDRAAVKLEVKREQLFIDAQGVPLRLIEMLVLKDDVEVNIKDILKLSKEGIATMYLAKNNKDMALTLPLFSKNSELKVLQYEALTKQRLVLAKYFLEEKTTRHSVHLKSLSVQIDGQAWKDKITQAKSVEILLGIEGSFSRLYFEQYFKLFEPAVHKAKRSRQPALDPVNAMLNYCYTMTYNILTAKLYMAGFDPSISYLHTPFRSHYALSSDMMELFRAKLNAQVLAWFHDKALGMEDFSIKQGVWLRYESRKRLWKDLKILLQDISKEADKEIALLRVAIS